MKAAIFVCLGLRNSLAFQHVRSHGKAQSRFGNFSFLFICCCCFCLLIKYLIGIYCPSSYFRSNINKTIIRKRKQGFQEWVCVEVRVTIRINLAQANSVEFPIYFDQIFRNLMNRGRNYITNYFWELLVKFQIRMRRKTLTRVFAKHTICFFFIRNKSIFSWVILNLLRWALAITPRNLWPL